MLIVVQFPMADIRPLLSTSPPFSYPPLRPQTREGGKPDGLRGFGWAEIRQSGTDEAFPDEVTYFSAHNALLLKGLGKKAFANAGVTVRPEITSARRLYRAKGGLPVRVEVGIGVRPNHVLDGSGLVDLLGATMNLRTAVRPLGPSPLVEVADRSSDPGLAADGPLILKSKALAAHFAAATSAAGSAAGLAAAHLVVHCQPMIIASLEPGELADSTPNELPSFRKLERTQTGGLDVWFGQVSAGSRHAIPCWLIGPANAKPDKIRRLRLCLLRLHAEHRVLEEVLRWYERNKSPKLDDAKLATYLRSVWDTVLERRNRAGLDQSALLAALAAAAAIRPEASSVELKGRVVELMKELGQKPLRGAASVARPANWQEWLEQMPAADLTVVLRCEPDSNQLEWTFLSKHALEGLPTEPESKSIGPKPEEVANFLLDMAKEKNSPLKYNLNGIGLTIGDMVPPILWDLLRDLTEQLNRKPTLLLLSQDPYVPWELAKESDETDFLGVRAIVGRWLLKSSGTAVSDPPVELQISSAAFVSGTYNQGNLEGAQDEVKKISRFLREASAAPEVKELDANLATVRGYLRSGQKDRLIHFAVHGRFAQLSSATGFKLTDGTLGIFEVKGYRLKGRPFVFLNACEIGAATKVLDSVEGMAEAFLQAGAAAVVAPIWAIEDGLANEIALAFYTQALDGNSPRSAADFFSKQRESFKVDDEASTTTYLAYKFYGHPELRLSLAKEQNHEGRAEPIRNASDTG